MERICYPRTFIWPSAREWWAALRWVLLTFTLLVALALAGSFFSCERVLAEGHPWLPRFHCAGCPLCGMTRAFCALSAGRWQDALRWNRGAPALYVGFWLWLIAAASYFVRAFGPRLERGLRFGVPAYSLGTWDKRAAPLTLPLTFSRAWCYTSSARQP